MMKPSSFKLFQVDDSLKDKISDIFDPFDYAREVLGSGTCPGCQAQVRVSRASMRNSWIWSPTTCHGDKLRLCLSSLPLLMIMSLLIIWPLRGSTCDRGIDHFKEKSCDTGCSLDFVRKSSDSLDKLLICSFCALDFTELVHICHIVVLNCIDLVNCDILWRLFHS